MHDRSPSGRSRGRTRRAAPSLISIRGPLLRFAVAGLLGAAVPLLISCGGSGAGLIPVENAGPLQSDFETVAQAAESGGGSCIATEAAILKTERDFSALPTGIDRGLRNRLQEGITKLHANALELCRQPLVQTTGTETSPKTTTSTGTTTTTPTVTQTTTTPTTPTTSPTTSGPGGGTPAPGPGGEAAPGAGSEPGGSGVGEAVHPGGSGGAGAGAGQEAGK